MLVQVASTGAFARHTPIATGPGLSWPRSAWTVEQYTTSLRGMAAAHAAWWGDAHWEPLPCVYEPAPLVEEARAAVLRLEASGLYRAVLSPERVRLLLAVLDNPHWLVDIMYALPRTLLIAESALPDFDGDSYGPPPAYAGPAPYDLACFYSCSRWWFGRTPLSTVDTRNIYLDHLNSALAEPLDRCLFDIGFDAALAWRFAVAWTPRLAANPALFLARSQVTRAALVDPAFASLSRVLRS